MKKNRIILLVALITSHTIGLAQKNKLPDYKNKLIPIEQRVKDLLSKMTLEEKIVQLQCIMTEYNGKNLDQIAKGNMTSVFGYHAPSEAAKRYNTMQKDIIEKTRLGIPTILHGEAVFGLMSNKTTCFPQPIMQASTFNPTLQFKMAEAISKEVRSRGHRQVLSPTINVAYDPRWGRTHETYGEDPYLVSKMGVAYIKAMQGNGIICTPKHFAANIGHNGAFGGPVMLSERFLREVELPPFKAAIMEAKARSIMPAYNTIDGIPCAINSWLLNDVLRKEWKFSGFVSSDYGAMREVVKVHKITENNAEAAAMGIKAGMEVEMPFPSLYANDLIQAVNSGMLEMKYIDTAVSRVLTQKFSIGLFDDPYVKPELADQICDSDNHRKIALEVAQQGIVLLKNEQSVLPFSKKIQSIAVLGPLADNLLLGNYAPWGIKKVSILQGIKNKLGSQCKYYVEKGVELTQLALPTISEKLLFVPNDELNRNGFRAEYFNNKDLSGKPSLTKIDANIDFEWGEGVPDPFINADNFSVRWTSILKAPESGKFKIGLSVDDGARLYIDGKMVIDDWKGGAVRLDEIEYVFEKGKSYQIQIEYFEGSFGATCRLGWNAEPNANIPKALEAAEKADATVVVVGALDGEGKDRAELRLSNSQEDLIKALSKKGKPFVVILASGNVIATNEWINGTPALLDTWYPGEEGGTAVADVLFGDYNPGGKLPITFPKTTGQVPCYYYQRPDISASFIGYGNEPQFVFGHGLSYTTFEYSNLKIIKTNNDTYQVSADIKNTGKLKGDEVVQLYIKDQYASVAQAEKKLRGFERINLEPGQTKNVVFQIGNEDLGMYNAQMQWVVEKGNFDILLGSSSADIRLTQVLEVK
jgi:beta-glucosidase